MTRTRRIELSYHRLTDGHTFVFRFQRTDLVAGCGGPLLDAVYAHVLRGLLSMDEMREVCWAAWHAVCDGSGV